MTSDSFPSIMYRGLINTHIYNTSARVWISSKCSAYPNGWIFACGISYPTTACPSEWTIMFSRRNTCSVNEMQVFFSGALHGNERVGPTAVMEAAKLMVFGAKCYLDSSAEARTILGSFH